MTKADARRIIAQNKSNTAWFGENNITLIGENVATYEAMYDLFRNRCMLGEAETQCIIASLRLAGAIIS